MKKNFYVTTPIYYVNDTPHIGHTCTTVVADIIARYHRQLGENVFFLTGTDEHGANVAKSARKKSLAPQKFCNQIAQHYQKIWEELNISNDFFIRTTDTRHIKVVQAVLKNIYHNKDIYKGEYKGIYCLGCERFLIERDLVDNHCPFHPSRKIIQHTEKNYFFRLSKYTPRLIKLIESDKTNYIFPEGKRKEILTKLKEGVDDVSISREKVKWGIPFPWDKSHTVYVWFDALINYYSATQFLPNKKKFWPANIHLIGKEILWFHTVIWPAMLISAKLPLPKQVFAHSFYTIDGQKMSKSLGNVISPKDLLKEFGVDGSRYLIASSFPAQDDTDIGLARFREKYNADLANNLGNLISRVAKLSAKLSLIPLEQKVKIYPQTAAAIKESDFTKALTYIWQEKIDRCNVLINEKKPWQQSPLQAEKTLLSVIKEVQQVAYNIKPFMPKTAGKIETVFVPGQPVKPLKKPIFPRL